MYLDASASILSLNETEAANFHLDHYRQYISGVIPNAMAMLYMYPVFNDLLLDIISYSMSTNGLQTIHFAVKYHLTRALFNRILSPLAEVSAIITKIEMTLLVQNVRMTKLQMMINSWIHSHQIIHQQRILHTVPLQNGTKTTVNIPSACIHAAMMDHVRIWRSEAIDSDLDISQHTQGASPLAVPFINTTAGRAKIFAETAWNSVPPVNPMAGRAESNKP